MTDEKYLIILETMADAIKKKDEEIVYQKKEIDELKERINRLLV